MDYKSPLNESDQFGNNGNNKSTPVLSVPSKFDNTDKKSLELLLQGSIFNNARNYKQASISTYLTSPSKTANNMKKKVKSRSKTVRKTNSPKTIGKLKRGGASRISKSHNDSSPKLTDMTWLRNTAKTKCDNKAAQVKKEELCSNSLTKNGMHIQSFEEIQKEMQECNNNKNCLENPTPMDTSLCLPPVTDNEPEPKENLLVFKTDSPKTYGKLKRGGTSRISKSHNDSSPKLTNVTWLRNTDKSKCDNEAAQVKKEELSSNSLTKNGMHIQSFEEIQKEMQECNNYKKCLENPTPKDTSLCLPPVTDNEPEPKENLLVFKTDSPKTYGKLKWGGTSRISKSHNYSSPKVTDINISDDISPKLTDITWLWNTAESKWDNKTTQAQKKLTSSSFTKYGMHIQSFEDILKDMKDCTKYKKCLEDLTPIDTSLCLPQVTEDEPESKENLLDCKYMTKRKIRSAFRRNFYYLQEICSGQRYSERHNLYLRSKSCNGGELNYNTSMIVFTGEQKQILANLLYKKFGKSSLDGHYYFKVLLPEVCLKIFMEEHNMSYAEASNYLNQRPVDA